MKLLLSLVVLIIFSQIAFAQTKVAENEYINSDYEAEPIMDFVRRLQKELESKGLIVIYSGENEKKLADVLRHIDGIKQFVGKQFIDRIFFKVDEGKLPLFKEFWIYPKNITIPKIEEKSINLDSLKTAYFYASICADCEPQHLRLSTSFVDFDLYADLLKKYAEYTGLIIINPGFQEGQSRKVSYNNALKYAVSYRNILVKEYKLNNKRIIIKIAKPINNDIPTFAKFFIVPKKVKQNRF